MLHYQKRDRDGKAKFNKEQLDAVNKLILDATDPLSKQTDFKKCPVKITKIA